MKKTLAWLMMAGLLLTLSGCWPYYHHGGRNSGYHHMYNNSDTNGFM